MFLLETNHHSAEVLADKVFEEVMDSVAFLDAMLLEELVRQVAACFECKLLGKAEGVIAVEEDVFNLLCCQPDYRKSEILEILLGACWNL